MKNRGAAGRVIPVPHKQSLKIRCEIESIEGSFRGELEDEQGLNRSFNGWTEFATALMALSRGTQDKTKINEHRGERNMKNIRNMKRPRLATIMAGLALFIVLGGSATAASGLINGKKIKKGTVTAKQIKNKTITKNKLKPALVKSLKGKTGPKGDTGANGVVEPIYGEFGSVNLPANTEQGIGTINVPAGKYMVTATAGVFSIGTAIFGCVVSAGGNFSETSSWNSPVANSRTTLPMQMVTADNVTSITIACTPGNINGSATGTIIATPVQ